MKMPDAAERKVLMITTFVSGCIALAPMEWTSAGVLLGLSGLLFALNQRLTRLEKAAFAQASPLIAALHPDAMTLPSATPEPELAEPGAAIAPPHAESASPPAAG